MPSSLTIDDFKPFNVTCEWRYDNAYLLYDETGRIIQDLQELFTNVNVTVASPALTEFTADEGSFSLGLGSSRITSAQEHASAESFARNCKAFLRVVADRLHVSVFTRIGLRYILRREYRTEEDAKVALATLTLANLRPTKRFNSSDAPTEIAFRWEDAEIGALVRLKAEKLNLKLAIPPELRDAVQPVDKKLTFVTLDIDYYTVAAVTRDQWNPEEWVPQKLRTIRKEADGILQGGGR
jgi:uncharacterized protein (TIGR04255 family)